MVQALWSSLSEPHEEPSRSSSQPAQNSGTKLCDIFIYCLVAAGQFCDLAELYKKFHKKNTMVDPLSFEGGNIEGTGVFFSTFTWNVSEWKHPNCDTRGRLIAKCEWWKLMYLVEFHKRFDQGSKKEERIKWLLGLGGSDASNLCQGP